MSIRLGDKVRFVNENMEGVVTRLSGNTAGVTIEDDFEIPVLLNEIVKIPDTTAPLAESKSVTQKPQFVKVHSGVHIAFDRLNETRVELKLHNSESDYILFAFYERGRDGGQLKKTGEIELEQHVSLGTYDLEQFNTWPSFQFQVMFLNADGNNLKNQLLKTIRFSAKEFHAAFRQCYFLGRQAYTFRLDEAFSAADLDKLKQKDFAEKPAAGNTPNNFQPKQADVIDLHIEQLTADHARMKPAEMIDYQMDAFVKSLDMANVHGQKKLVVIHGVGNHFLKNKIRNYLSRNKQLYKEFREADMLRYGGGATEIVLA